MCTSLTLQSKTGDNFLGRTMDFAFELDGRPLFVPKNYVWTSQLGESFKVKYGFTGTGRKLSEYLVADGMNEKGLGIAELFFSGEAKYQENPDDHKINLAPHELILWILGEIATIAELRKKIDQINLVVMEAELVDIVVPLHFIVTDRTGETVILESNTGNLVVKDNPVGVLTGSPEFEWHLKNLNNYVSLSPFGHSSKQLDKLLIQSFGQGSGTIGLPGGNTSPERFVRTVYNQNYCEKSINANDNINTLFQLLNDVTIPRGVSIKKDGTIHYTQYRVAFDLENLIYYYGPANTQEIFSLSLAKLLKEETHVKEFPIRSAFRATSLI